MDKIIRYGCCLLAAILTLQMCLSAIYAAAEGGETSFKIRKFEVKGNSIFPPEKLQAAVAPFTGSGKTAADVEKARDALEKLYHEAGYPAVMVNIPEQTLKGGIVNLQVIESKISRVRITGNRYFTMEKVMRDLPSLTPGKILYLPDVQKEISRLNRNQDFKIDPVMSPGKELGLIDVELKVEDKFPLHGSVELNNRSSHNTTDLRLNTVLHYDNLWQKDHSASLQYQMSPQNASEVEVFGGSYVLPAPWDPDNQLALYGIWSDSNTAFGEGFTVIGKGEIVGARYVIPLLPQRLYAHQITLGLDYKHFDQDVGYSENGETTHTPVTYLPFFLSYSASLPDEWGGMTRFSGGLNISFRGVVSDENEFEQKRYKAQADYVFFTAEIDRNQKLPWGMSLFVKMDGQVSDQPLIANEEYQAGGMENVRGYLESEVAGDDAIHGTVELIFPDPLDEFGIGKRLQMAPFIFYDIAMLDIKDPLPGQDSAYKLEGTGAGIRGSIMKNMEYELDWAMALDETAGIERNGQRLYFKLKAIF